MKLRELFAAAYRTAAARWVSSTMLVVLITALSLSTAAILGQSLAAQKEVQDKLESAGVRQISIRDTRDGGFLNGHLISTLATVNTIERVYGLSHPADVRNEALGRGSNTIPLWGFVGEVEDAVVLESGRLPKEGEAIISTTAQDTVQFTTPFGSLDGVAVVGSYTPLPGNEHLGAGAIKLQQSQTANEIILLATQPSEVSRTLVAALNIIDQPSSSLDIVSPQSIAEIQEDILGGLQETTRQQAIYALGLGILLVGAVALSDVMLNRQDIGRRRALGATRSTIVGYMVTRIAVPGIVGTLLSAGVLYAAVLGGSLQVPAQFPAAVCVLNLLVMICAAIPPALVSAFQDPVKVLRVP